MHDSTHLLWCYDTPSKVSFNQVNIFASASQTINHAHVGSTGIGILMICAGVEWKGDQHALRNIHGIIFHYFFLCVKNILLHDFAHLGWCDTCVERRAKTDNDCFIVSIFAEGVQSREQRFLENVADLYMG